MKEQYREFPYDRAMYLRRVKKMTYKEIAKALKWHPRLVKRNCEKLPTLDMMRGPKGGPDLRYKIHPNHRAKIRQLYDMGYSLSELAWAYGCSRQNIWYIVNPDKRPKDTYQYKNRKKQKEYHKAWRERNARDRQSERTDNGDSR